MQQHVDAGGEVQTGVEELDALAEGRETLMSVPNSDVAYHYFRRTGDGFEHRTAATEWEPISVREIQRAFEQS